MNAACWNAGEQTLNQGYNTFEIRVGQVSKMIVLIFIKESTSVYLQYKACSHDKQHLSIASAALHDRYHNAEQSAPYDGFDTCC